MDKSISIIDFDAPGNEKEGDVVNDGEARSVSPSEGDLGKIQSKTIIDPRALDEFWAYVYNCILPQFLARNKDRLPIDDLKDIFQEVSCWINNRILSGEIDFARNVKGYVWTRLSGSVLDELRKRDPLSKGQRKIYHRVMKSLAHRGELSAALDDNGITREVWNRIRVECANVVHLSIDSTRGKDENGRKLEAQIPNGELGVDDVFVQQEFADVYKDFARNVFSRMPLRLAVIFFLVVYQGREQKEMYSVLSVSPSRISQLLPKAKEAFKVAVEKSGVERLGVRATAELPRSLELDAIILDVLAKRLSAKRKGYGAIRRKLLDLTGK